MKRLLLLSLSLTLVLSTAFAQSADYTIFFKSGNLQLEELDDQRTLGEVKTSLNNNNDYYIVQFDRIPTESEKAKLASDGINLLEYIPSHSFIANIDNLQASATLGSLGIRSIASFEAIHKYPDYFDLSSAPDYVYVSSNKVRLMVDRQLDKTTVEFVNFLESNSIEVEEIGIMGENFKIIIDKNRIDWLQDQSIVKFIDYAPAPPVAEDTEGRTLHRANMLDSENPMGRKLTGDGVSMAIADNGLGPHIDRKGRVTMHTTVNGGTHGDMTTGIAVGAGNLDPRYKGMATKAYLHYYNISGYPHINNAGTNYTLNGVAITSTSFSQGCNAGYTSDTRATDLQVNTYGSILHVFSAGNSSSSTCGSSAYGAGTPWGTITGGIKQGKTVIATGNVFYTGGLVNSSSRGPAADGRIKPDICANGGSQMSTDPNNGYSPGGGTSAASPGIAGVAAQIYEGYRNLNSNQDPPSGLIKAALLNTATDAGNIGPDYFYGWGIVNAHRAMLLLEENRYINSSISQNNSNSHNIVLTNPAEELKVMVYWTDVAGAAFSARALVNDIDVRVVTPNGDTLLPWVLHTAPNASLLAQAARKGNDNLNNMEQVVVDTAAAGTYTVLVNGTAIPSGPQSYHLVWESLTDSIEVTYPNGGESFVPGEPQTIRWDAYGNSGVFTVEYSSNNGASWNSIGTTAGNLRYRNWSVPNISSGDLLVRVSRSGNVTGVSQNTFNIYRQPNGLSVAFTCPDSVQISWNASPGAINYDVYRLGQRFMDSVATTTGTNHTFYNMNLADENWWAIRANANGVKGRRTIARLVPQTPLNCPIDYDLELTQISNPSSDYLQNCGSNNKFPVSVLVNNKGDSILNNVPLRLISGNNTYYDTIPGPILSNANLVFTFSDSVTSTPGLMPISVVNDLAADQNEINDSIAKTITVINSTVFTVPYSNDFENFNVCATTSNCGGTTCLLNGGWTNVSNNIDDFDMRVDFGGTPSASTGPTIDHNPGTASGKYIYSEASNGCTGVESQVLSPCFDLSGTIAPEFSFWYNMYGSSMGILYMDILTPNGWVFNAITPLFGNQGQVWQQQTVNLSNYIGQTISIRFRVVTGSSFYSDLALDDVQLIDRGVGLADIKTDEYNLFPNPSTGMFNIQFKKGQIGDFRIFDLQGRNVFTGYESSSNVEIDLGHLDKGIYIIEFEEGKREKIILQ